MRRGNRIRVLFLSEVSEWLILIFGYLSLLDIRRWLKTASLFPPAEAFSLWFGVFAAATSDSLRLPPFQSRRTPLVCRVKTQTIKRHRSFRASGDCDTRLCCEYKATFMAQKIKNILLADYPKT